MKQIFLLLTAVSLASLALAQAPQKFSSQIVIRDATGDLVSEAPVQIRITIIQGEPQGFLELQEIHSLTTNVNGLASFEIGAGTWVFGFVEAIDWSNGPYFIQTEVDPNNSSNYTISSTTELLSVPYALFANEAGNSTFKTNGNVTTNSGGDYATDNFVFGSPQLNADGNIDHAGRMFFNKSKSAFRAGRSFDDGWNDQNIGTASMAFGSGTVASGNRSSAFGDLSIASGDYTTACGRSSMAIGTFSMAVGHSTTSYSQAELVIGAYNTSYIPMSEFEWFSQDRLFVIGNGTNLIASDAMVVLKNGNTGFGTSSPNEILEIAGDGRAFFGDGQGDNRKGLLIDGIQGANAARIEAFDYGTGNGMDLVLNSASTGGNVGVRTNNPTATLSVNGSANKTGGGSWAVFSDRRLKKDIISYEDGLSTVLAINPVTFKYNGISKADTTAEYVGVIAQELEEVSPYMINSIEIEGTEYLEVDNSAMTYMLINAVKEQQEIIENLQAENETKDLRIDDLDTRLQANSKLLQELNSIVKTIAER